MPMVIFVLIHIHVGSRLKVCVQLFLLAVFTVKKNIFTQATNWKLPFGRGKRVTSQGERGAQL